uniref:Uncharacterized protein n=1 Tax=Arundo donax TaxID=35708 RepID=A0A0A9ALZ8_ARUDO
MARFLRSQNKTLTKWSMNSRNVTRSGNRLVGGVSSTKTRTLTRSMTGTSTSTRRLSGPLASTRLKLRTTWKEGLPCQINYLAWCYLRWS